MTREEAIQALKKEKKTALHENKVAFDMAIKALEQEPCEDAVSRKALINAFPISDTYTLDDIIATIKFQPSVIPTREKGKWIEVTDTEFGIGYKCSECGRFILTESVDGRKLKDYPYCHCGADMRGGEERKEPSEWQQDHAILKAHSDGANEVLDRIKGARNEIEGLCKLEFMTKPLEIAVDRDAVLQIIDQLIAEVEG